MADTSVKMFSSEMSGAPVISTTLGTMINALDACLVNGFGDVTLDSLAVTGDVATATISTGHNIEMYGNTPYGPVIAISGATPVGLNGEWRVTSVADANTLTFAVSGITAGTATGTITLKRAPLGWEKTYSGTNTAAYSRLSVGATPAMVRVDDNTSAGYPGFRMYSDMSNVDTGTAVESYTRYLRTMNAEANNWRIIGTDKAFWMFTANGTANQWNKLFFGDFESFFPADTLNTIIVGYRTASTSVTNVAHRITAKEDSMLLGNYLGGNPVGAEAMWAGHITGYLVSWAIYYTPLVADYQLLPIYMSENKNIPRAFFPGIYGIINEDPGTQDGNIVYADGQLDGRPVLIQALKDTTAAIGVLLVGPW